MIIVGLVLLVLVVVFGIAVVVSNPDVHQLSIFRVLVPVTYGGVFFSGVGATVLTVLGVLLIRLGLRRAADQRRQRKLLGPATPIAPPEPKPTTVTDTSAGTAAAPPVTTDVSPSPTPAPTAPSSLDLEPPPGPAVKPPVASPATPPASTAPAVSAAEPSPTTAAERQAMLTEVEAITTDDDLR